MELIFSKNFILQSFYSSLSFSCTPSSLAKEIMLAIAKEVPDILKDPPPSVYFTEFGDSSLNLLMIFWVGEYTRMLDAKDSVNTIIHERFAREGIEIPFPIQSVFLKK